MNTFYARQKSLFTVEEHARLKAATVLIAGLGGLGSFVAEGLCRAGVGGLILLDHDRVSLPDLNRQILYHRDDVGRFKAQVAKERLLLVRDDLWVEAWVQRLTPKFAIPSRVSVVVDALDNWESRFILAERAERSGKFLVHAGLSGYYGQITTIAPDSLSLSEVFAGAQEDPHPEAYFPICAVLGGLMVEEVLKIICKREGTLSGRLLLVDLRSYEFELVPIAK